MDGKGDVLSVEGLAAVVIGRNEGSRLEASLRSVQAAGLRCVYVDSGSTDGSPDMAREFGVRLVQLDASRPYSAARGRNEGLREALRCWSDVLYVLFLDGDCVVEPDFPKAAVTALIQNPKRAVVTGHLSERSPESSIYNRMCAIEWRSPAGPIENMNALGGIMVIRASAFLDAGGFNETAIAGEEADLGVRLGLAGYSAIKVDRAMATHDAGMHRFGQWWTRAVRNGHSLAHRYATHGRTRFKDGQRGLRSAIFWGFVLPATALLLIWPTRGFSLLLLLAAYGLLGWRIYRHYSRQGQVKSDALLMARYLVCAKFAEFLGAVRYCINRLRGKFHIIEWK